MDKLAPGQVVKFDRNDGETAYYSGTIGFADIFAEGHGNVFDVAFIRWTPGEEAPFPDPLPYEEVLVILSGRYTVRTSQGEEITAGPGEVIYLAHGASGTYHSDVAVELIAVTSPPYRSALRAAGRGHELDAPG